MKNPFVVFLLLLCTVHSQMSSSNLEKLKNEQLDLIKDQIQLENDDEKQKIEAEIQEVYINTDLDDQVNESKFFGYDYFNNDLSFYDNTLPPSDFILGPGDEIILSLWGDTNLRLNFLINKEGQIFYENVGFINISGKTIPIAEEFLIDKLSSIYSTLSEENSSTNLSIELSRVKSVNIYFSGEVNNPGVHIIHPFSDLFASLTKSGGVKETGSLRNIQIIRKDIIIDNVDLYKFFINGKNSFSDVRLLDGDVVHVPVANNHSEITGAVVRPKIYELLQGETINNLIEYAGGLRSDASSTLIIDKIIPINERKSDDLAFTSLNVNLKDLKNFKLNNGDKVEVKSLRLSSSKVRVYGKVKNPGLYSAINSNLKTILDLAGGFDDPYFRKNIDENIVILRKDETQFYAKEFEVSYKDAENFQVDVDDKIFVYSKINYENSFTYRVEGQVNKPGTYVLKKGITLGEAINLAGGLTELSSESNIVVSQEFTELDENDNEITVVKPVGNADMNFELGSNSVINALQFENVISVEGNVYNPGLIAVDSSVTMSKAIELAGGYKPYSIIKRSYIKRANGEIVKANILRGRGKRVFPGDTVFVPVDPNPSDFDITTFIADFSSTLANIAAILIIVDNNQ